MPYLLLFDQKCLLWIFLGKNLRKTYVIFEISTLKFVFHEKPKMPKFGTKNACFGYFSGGIWKKYFHIWNHHACIYLIAKFGRKTKMSKFGTKNGLFGCFLARLLEKLLSYLKSAPSNLPNCKIFRKNKNT